MALPGATPLDLKGQQRPEEVPSRSALQQANGMWWEKCWKTGVAVGCLLSLCVFSQIMGVWILYMLNGYGAFPAAHKVLDLMQYLLSPIGAQGSLEEETIQKELWRMESLCPLLATLFIGIVILGIGVLYCLGALAPSSIPVFPDDRRQSMSRQPSFTYSEWTDPQQEDVFSADPVPETPVFDYCMDIKPESDPATLTVKSVGLQERRGSNVSLTLDMCTPGSTEPYAAMLSPREQSTKEYLQKASNVLTAVELQKRALDDAALQAEFFETPMNFVDPKEYNIPGVVRKNRYKTILPNTHSRVCLKATDPDDFLSTYINANYMRGYGGEEKAYIATQGPTVNTISDFWRMVWQEQSPLVVMITNIEEKNEKCAEYWPEERVTYEGIEITVDQLIQADDYSLRIFTLQCGGEKRSLRQYWYTSWPDQKTPDKAPPLLELVKEVEEARQQAPPRSGPVIVHCSAGIGRTGCFIATSILSKQLKNEGVVDILKTTCQLRLDRGGMIQTCEQYQFVHHVLSLYEKQLSCPVEE
ncbi:tyrosine-protein phosphatase non-receptor type 5 [Brienomyrus brachyistius]|uniref:tyrosine-protein phosphatase non-receptor type 5 n=1 Tax=Brienomyrus brachyistius TaxID=42636 RepID=UPI0020B2A5C4|nr:tyrosine-protein phosphatase non-receptor type 5 [Brienomyrus brachyistius]XP_048825710.1 tyrosine-protein phosphatase non-receptor type 5 [Brienomyrus brachyistius]XP_048825711.1 tyrosine-protein phosphatase non-receptor type 5 [Brienomyrus brachyistius]XP_048825712.1 tyrosine-protein phosphatase non-receptor type 5 [Brienomyrus brachyistius]XP_048825713.1 tyrosine-protein phosphatase non-receptor type 5 [Brienomyrus brachyistius]XP_048825714.1 tyrosine-protein phosphatase non-receptor typ